MDFLEKLAGVVRRDWHRESPRMLFNILLTFLATFTVAHLYSIFVPFYVFVRGYHIHHFYYGMFILAVTSVVGVITNRDNVRHGLSYFIGIGIGLIVDELGLLLTCTGEKWEVCSYFFPNTFDIVLIITLIFLIFIFFGDKPIRWFLPKAWRNNKELNRDVERHLRKLLK